jgi:hypothetical protein
MGDMAQQSHSSHVAHDGLLRQSVCKKVRLLQLPNCEVLVTAINVALPRNCGLELLEVVGKPANLWNSHPTDASPSANPGDEPLQEIAHKACKQIELVARHRQRLRT